MNLSGGAIVVRALEDEGIDLAFGIPGTHNIELYDALAESSSVKPVLVTDEQSASFMADGVWRASGRMACVNVVPGAGPHPCPLRHRRGLPGQRAHVGVGVRHPP